MGRRAAGMGPDLRHLASTPAPGERQEPCTDSPPQSTSPRHDKACSPPSSQRSPTETTPARLSQRSPLALHHVSGSPADQNHGDGSVGVDSPNAEQPMPQSVSFHDTVSIGSGSPAAEARHLKRSVSPQSDASVQTDGTVIVHEGSRSAGGDAEVADDAGLGSRAPLHASAFSGSRDVDDPVLQAEPTFAMNHSLHEPCPDSGGLQAEATSVSQSSNEAGERVLRPEPSLAVARAMPPSPFESMDDEAPLALEDKSAASVHTRSTGELSPKTRQAPGTASPGGEPMPKTPPRRCRSAGALPVTVRRLRSPALGIPVKARRVRRTGRLSDGGAVAQHPSLAEGAKRQLQFGSSFAGFPNATQPQQDWPAVRWTWTASASNPENSAEVAADNGAAGGAALPIAVPTLQPHIAMSSVFAGQSAGAGPSMRAGPISSDGTALAAATPPSSDGDHGSANKSRLGARSSTHSSASSLSHKSARPVGPMPAMHPEPHESESPSLRRSMSTGDEQLREAVRPSLLDWGVPESNIDWIVSKLNIDRHIDRTDTQDKILDGLWGWYTNLAGDKHADAVQDEAPSLPIQPVGRSQTLRSELADAEDPAAAGRSDGDTATEERGTTAAADQDVAIADADGAPESRPGTEAAEAEDAMPALPQPQPLLHRVFGSGALLDGGTRAGSRSLASPFAAAGSLQGMSVGHTGSLGLTATPALSSTVTVDGSTGALPPLMERPHTGVLPPSSSLPARVMHSRAVSMVVNPSDRTVKLTQQALKFCVIPSEGIAGTHFPCPRCSCTR